jgi:integrase
MPRKVRDASLETRTARGRLPVPADHKPYYRLIEPGLHQGYRKPASGPGTWVRRRWDPGAGKYKVENLRTPDGDLVLADDYAEADGVGVMSFAQAQTAIRGPRNATGALTVAGVMADYLKFLETDGRSAHAIRDARCRINAHIIPTLGSVKVPPPAERLRRWLSEIATVGPRLRTREGEQQKFRQGSDDEEALRRRRVSANRVLTIVKAAFNLAFREGRIESDASWRRVKAFKGVDAARVRYLTLAEVTRLLNACTADFRKLVQAALQTGCRYSELTRLVAGDYNPDAGTVHIRKSKTAKARHVVLTEEGVALFGELVAGREKNARILSRPDGSAWSQNHQTLPMIEACERATISPAVSFHILRHTWASHAIMNGVPLMVVAKNLGHADTRMVERHYGHLAPNYVTDSIRAGAPRFGLAQGNVRPLR